MPSPPPPCREQLLSRVAEGSFDVPGMTAVTKRVYASPVTTSVNLERPDARAGIGSTQPCYPNLCFAVENFDDTFSDQVYVCRALPATLPSAPEKSHTPEEAA